MSDWEEEGQYTVGREATDLLRRTGCIGRGHGEKRVAADQELLMLLYLSTCIRKLTKKVILVLGCRNIAIGARRFYVDVDPFDLPYTILTLAAATVSIFILLYLHQVAN